MVQICAINELTLAMLQPTLDESLQEGYPFIQRLWDEYQSGVQTFRGVGEILLGAYVGDKMVGIGGLHVDHYLNLPHIGRIRHVYVLAQHRHAGIGKLLVQKLIDHTVHGNFSTLTLRTNTAHGRAFYEALGFSAALRFENATHWLDIE